MLSHCSREFPIIAVTETCFSWQKNRPCLPLASLSSILQSELIRLEDATHIALHTVTRFLEIHGETIEKVLFSVSELEEANYQKLLPLNFPRSLKEESWSLPYLPADIGTTEGPWCLSRKLG